MDCRQPSSSVRGISQARILEWVAISFSRASSWPRDRTHVSCFLHWPEDSLPPGEKSVTSLFFDKNVYFCNYFIILLFICSSFLCKYFPGGSDGKEPACSAGDPGSIPGLGRCPGEGQGNHSLEKSCLENPTTGGAWRAAVHGVTQSDSTEVT